MRANFGGLKMGVPSLCTVMSMRGLEGQGAICHTSCGCEWTSAIRMVSFSGSNSSSWTCKRRMRFQSISKNYCRVKRPCATTELVKYGNHLVLIPQRICTHKPAGVAVL